MALSNWDTLAFDEKGESSTGDFTSKLGVEVEVYKNWLYVRDEKAWVDGGQFVKSTVMQIQHGEITYKDIHVVALRGPQNGVYAFVWSGWEHEKTLTGMIGIGVYGYDDRGEFIGVTTDSLEWFKEQIKTGDLDVPKVLKEIDLSKGQRFNQGDAFFAQHLGEGIPATPPGEAGPTVVSQIIKNTK